MAEDMRNDIQISLKTIDELFTEPEADPFDPASRYQSGISEITGQLRFMPLNQGTRVAIRLPAEAIQPDTPARTKEAMGRYCTARIEENQQALIENRWVGRRSLVSAILICVALLGAFIVFSQLVKLPDVVIAVLGSWLGIAVWVIMWDPIYTYVYAWRPYRREEHVYQNLRQADLVIEASS